MPTVTPTATTPAAAPAAPPAPAAAPVQVPVPTAATAPKIDPEGTYTAHLATSDGNIAVQLLPKVGPNAVTNFVYLAQQGFYTHVPIHRVVPGFMFQSGDPTGTGMGGPGYNIFDDPVPADAKYTTGVMAMANTGQPNSGGSQFFIMLGDVDLPPTYSIFGKVTAGQDVLAKLNQTQVTDNGQGELSKPVTPIEISSITVEGPGL